MPLTAEQERERQRLKGIKYRATHAEQCKLRSKLYYATNKEVIKAKARAAREKSPERFKLYGKLRREKEKQLPKGAKPKPVQLTPAARERLVRYQQQRMEKLRWDRSPATLSARLNHRLREIHHGAKLKEHEMALSDRTILHLIQQTCTYCGVSPELGPFGTNGIDRVDSGRGYVAGNCVPCCKRCNQMKSKRKVEEFFDAVRSIIAHQELRPFHAPPLDWGDVLDTDDESSPTEKSDDESYSCHSP